MFITSQSNYNQIYKFIIEHAGCIAKASQEDWLSFIGLKYAISDNEAKFIKSLEELFVKVN